MMYLHDTGRADPRLDSDMRSPAMLRFARLRLRPTHSNAAPLRKLRCPYASVSSDFRRGWRRSDFHAPGPAENQSVGPDNRPASVPYR
jgi:hypothetical protein